MHWNFRQKKSHEFNDFRFLWKYYLLGFFFFFVIWLQPWLLVLFAHKVRHYKNYSEQHVSHKPHYVAKTHVLREKCIWNYRHIGCYGQMLVIHLLVPFRCCLHVCVYVCVPALICVSLCVLWTLPKIQRLKM